MITKEQVSQSLSPIIENQFGFVPPDNFSFYPTIILKRYEDGSVQSISIDVFTNLFQDAEDMTASALLVIDGGTMGYETFIKEWQEKGYIV